MGNRIHTVLGYSFDGGDIFSDKNDKIDLKSYVTNGKLFRPKKRFDFDVKFDKAISFPIFIDYSKIL